jgi:hypothetical protein
MNLHAVELGITLIDYFTSMDPKCLLSKASQSTQESASNKRADKLAGGGDFLAPL